MKKILTLTLILIMCLSIASCGRTTNNTVGSDNNSNIQGQQSSATGKKESKAESADTPGKKENKILVAYFSRTGNTEVIANLIHESVGGDIFKIVTVDPYPTDYNACVEQARKELESNYRPKLATRVENMESYDVIFLGYPNWCGTMPMAVFTFLEEYNFSGKTIIPFCTHEGSGLGNSVRDIARLCPNSTLLDGLAIRGSNVRSAQTQKDVADWLRKIGMAE
ncbi:flavodoxins [Moorella thermoacetica Y72]|uniref:Flavodoxins n=1 Tax=Moorella thermoacetica Y72 TaxID=1325331 RepID=A0A0S6UB49_NEOTH|nr:flavodoxin [Moorella thermoacetica]GAF26210.1 flavodoxins [Moorella thermoacetica Y72]